MKTMKRILCLALILCLMAGFFPARAAAAGDLPFTDVAEGAWYRDSVEYVYTNGIMSGTAADKFSPNLTTTRGMIVTILHRIAGSPSAVGESFTDVPAGKYYASPVAWASSAGIVTGYGNGRFGPDNSISREQLATILYRYAAYAGLSTEGRAELGTYSDSGKISSYAREAFSWAVDAGLISGTGGDKLDPAGSATRAQVAVIFTRLLTSDALTQPKAVGDYAICDLSLSGSDLTALLSAPEACSIRFEVLSEDSSLSLWSGSFPVSGGLQMDYRDFATGFKFPESFIIKAVLLDGEGNALCPEFICRRYTAAYRAFAALTEADFTAEGSRMIDIAQSLDGNFALLREDVILLDASPLSEKEGVHEFRSSELPAGLGEGDKICFLDAEGRWAAVEISSLRRSGGKILISEAADTGIDDFYELIKLSVDLNGGENAEMSLAAASQNKDKKWMGEIEMGPAVSNDFSTPFGSLAHETSVGGKLEFNFGIEDWEGYAEFTLIAGIETELNLEIGPHSKLDGELEIASIPLTGIPDVADIPAELNLVYELDCDAGFDTTVSVEAATGFVYNTLDGSQRVEYKEIATGETVLEGEIEAKLGIEASIKAEVFDGKASAGLGAGGGVGFSARGEVPLAPLPGSASFHACKLCADGTLFGYFEADIGAEVKLSKKFEGKAIDLDLLALRWDITRFYISLINEPESVHGGKVAFDMGACPNKKYLTSFNTYYMTRLKTGIPVSILLTDGSVETGDSSYQSYLYPGSYTASATVKGDTDTRAFTVKDSASTVNLQTWEHLLSGTVTDKNTGKPLSGATVSIEGIGTFTTDASGKYSTYLPDGTYNVTFSAEGHKSADASVSLSGGKGCTLNKALESGKFKVTILATSWGNPAANATIKSGAFEDVTTDENGQAVVELPAGSYWITGYTYDLYGSTQITVKGDMSVTLDIWQVIHRH